MPPTKQKSTRHLILPFLFFLLLCDLCGLCGKSLFADTPWQAPGWSNRAIITVEPNGDTISDVAFVHLIHSGQLSADARDLRLFDETNQPVPYEVTYHDPARDSYLSFRIKPIRAQKQTFFLYFTNPAAPVDPARVLSSPFGQGAPKPGPSGNNWIPHVGLVLTTLQRNNAPNPDDFNQMLALIDKSPATLGADYHPNISDSFNPFGPSSSFISIYRGWINIPEEGEHSFCTDSNEASFSFIDGTTLVHWPGLHTAKHGRRGEYNTTRHLAAGPHYIEYYHENGDQTSVAFLGYEHPGDRQFRAVPNSFFPAPHPAHVVHYEQAIAGNGRPTLMPHIVMMDSAWSDEKPPSQYARFGFSGDPGIDAMDLSKWKIHWDFGDGISADGISVEHVYSSIRVYNITMNATGPSAESIVRKWPLNVFRVDEIAGPFRTGDLKSYAKSVGAYDPKKLTTHDLSEAAKLLGANGQQTNAKTFAQALLTRPDASSEEQAKAHLLLGTMPSSPQSNGAVDPAVARENARQLEEAWKHETDAIKRVELSTTLIRTLGQDANDVDAAQKAYDRAAADAKQAGGERKMYKACRDAMLAMADVLLYAGQTDKASDLYRTAETTGVTPIPAGVRASKIGAYSEAIDQQIEHHNYADAREVIKRWKDELPSDQVRGTLAFYEGKLAFLSGRPGDAIRPLKLAVALAMGSDFEAEARYLQAQSQKFVGDADGYKRTLRGLINSGLTGPFRDKAAAELNVK